MSSVASICKMSDCLNVEINKKKKKTSKDNDSYKKFGQFNDIISTISIDKKQYSMASCIKKNAGV